MVHNVQVLSLRLVHRCQNNSTFQVQSHVYVIRKKAKLGYIAQEITNVCTSYDHLPEY